MLGLGVFVFGAWCFGFLSLVFWAWGFGICRVQAGGLPRLEICT